MLINKKGELIKTLDFRGTKIEFLDKLTAKEILVAMMHAQRLVNRKDDFRARDLIPREGEGAAEMYQPILNACKKGDAPTAEEKKNADRLCGVIIKSALIMSPLLFTQNEAENEWEGTIYTRQ